MIARLPSVSPLPPEPDPVMPNAEATGQRALLLATDASPAAAAATHIAALLAARWNATTHACTVVPPPTTTFDGLVVTAPALERELQIEVDRQLDAIEWQPSHLTRELAVGAPASEIVRLAEAARSDLIVLGLRPHAMLDRVFRDETALSVMRHGSIPVLAVTPMLARLPQHIAVAIDFSRASIAAARAALTLLGDGGTLSLVYVEPPALQSEPDAQAFTSVYAQGLLAAFERLRTELTRTHAVTIETVILHGAVAPALLAFARTAKADLLAVGSQRHTIARRAIVGSVTTALARAAECSMLVIPPGHRTA